MTKKVEPKRLTLNDPCAKSKDGKHKDNGGMFFFTCEHCGLIDEDGLDATAGAMVDNYPRLGR